MIFHRSPKPRYLRVTGNVPVNSAQLGRIKLFFEAAVTPPLPHLWRRDSRPQRISGHATGTPDAPRRWVKKATVLAVDDKHANLISLEAVFGAEYELVCASNGADAIAAVKSRSDIDLILMDVQMPIMDGFETASRIKDLPEGKDIPIVFITAVFSEDPSVKRGYEVGGIDYFYKPFDPEILKRKVAAYTSFRRRVQEAAALRRVGADLTASLERLPVSVLVADADGKVLGNSEGRNWNPRLLKAVEGVLDRVIRGQESPLRVRIDEPGPDGSRRRFLCSAIQLHSGGAVVVVHDLTTALKLEAELEKHATRLAS